MSFATFLTTLIGDESVNIEFFEHDMLQDEQDSNSFVSFGCAYSVDHENNITISRKKSRPLSTFLSLFLLKRAHGDHSSPPYLLSLSPCGQKP